MFKNLTDFTLLKVAANTGQAPRFAQRCKIVNYDCKKYITNAIFLKNFLNLKIGGNLVFRAEIVSFQTGANTHVFWEEGKKERKKERKKEGRKEK